MSRTVTSLEIYRLSNDVTQNVYNGKLIIVLYYSVKDGEFRQYKSPRDRESLVDFIRSKTWMKVEPVPSWKSPTSIQMTLMSKFFKLSQVLRVSLFIYYSYNYLCH